MILDILEVKIPRLEYGCTNMEKLLDSIDVHVNVSVTIGTHKEEKDLKTAVLHLQLFLFEQDSVENLSENKQNADGFYIADYKAWFRTDAEESKELEITIIKYLEPYFQKGILDFSIEAGLPPLNIPYRFWENVTKQK